MYSFAFEFETEQEMEQAAEQLWKKHGVTGEFEMFLANNGKFRLQVFAEKQIKESVLEKLPGKRSHTKASPAPVATAPQEELSDDD